MAQLWFWNKGSTSTLSATEFFTQSLRSYYLPPQFLNGMQNRGPGPHGPWGFANDADINDQEKEVVLAGSSCQCVFTVDQFQRSTLTTAFSGATFGVYGCIPILFTLYRRLLFSHMISRSETRNKIPKSVWLDKICFPKTEKLEICLKVQYL